MDNTIFDIGTIVTVNEPRDCDYWNCGFTGTVVKINDGYYTIIDMDGDYFDVDFDCVESEESE